MQKRIVGEDGRCKARVLDVQFFAVGVPIGDYLRFKLAQGIAQPQQVLTATLGDDIEIVGLPVGDVIEDERKAAGQDVLDVLIIKNANQPLNVQR